MENSKYCILFKIQTPVQCNASASWSVICLIVLLKIKTSVRNPWRLTWLFWRQECIGINPCVVKKNMRQFSAGVKQGRRLEGLPLVTAGTHAHQWATAEEAELELRRNSGFRLMKPSWPEVLPQWWGEVQNACTQTLCIFPQLYTGPATLGALLRGHSGLIKSREEGWEPRLSCPTRSPKGLISTNTAESE